ncbi:MAG: WecB/TagA/CpsF family glycosyltransferase [Armatimonadetes bacterium]|nr:WecB/TagA/CpsF family glycosyltransferase [Armatimonadota bacterium]
MAEVAVTPGIQLPERVEILGFPIDRVTLDETRRLMRDYLASDGTKLILTADSNAYINAATDDGYRRMFREAALITPDSAGPVWALSRLGRPVPGRVSGVDLVECLCQLSAETGARMYFLGSAPGIAELAAKNLAERFPGMVVAGARDGYFSKDDDTRIAQEIAETKPDVLVVAMGMPRQELFILDTAEAIGAKIGIGVGGSLDVHSGTVKRAPKVIQKIKMEWLWRLLLNPKKIAKVRNLPVFYWRVRRSKPL